jgi:hypothetical protein
MDFTIFLKDLLCPLETGVEIQYGYRGWKLGACVQEFSVRNIVKLSACREEWTVIPINNLKEINYSIVDRNDVIQNGDQVWVLL